MTTDKRAAAIAALQKAREALSRVCREQGGKLTMCVPARPDQDDDLVIGDALHKALAALEADDGRALLRHLLAHGRQEWSGERWWPEVGAEIVRILDAPEQPAPEPAAPHADDEANAGTSGKGRTDGRVQEVRRQADHLPPVFPGEQVSRRVPDIQVQRGSVADDAASGNECVEERAAPAQPDRGEPERVAHADDEARILAWATGPVAERTPAKAVAIMRSLAAGKAKAEAELADLRAKLADAERERDDLREQVGDKGFSLLQQERDEAVADMLSVAQQVGIVYEAEGHAPKAGPTPAILRAIAAMQRDADDAPRLRSAGVSLKFKLTEATAERDAAVAKLAEAEKRLTTAMCNVAEAEDERNDARSSCFAAKAERDAAVAKLAEAEKKKDAFFQSLSRAMETLDHIRDKHVQGDDVSDHEGIAQAVDRIAAEREAAVAKLADAERQTQRWKVAALEMQKQRDAAAQNARAVEELEAFGSNSLDLRFLPPEAPVQVVRDIIARGLRERLAALRAAKPDRCSQCGACSAKEAETKCRAAQDITGEYWCPGSELWDETVASLRAAKPEPANYADSKFGPWPGDAKPEPAAEPVPAAADAKPGDEVLREFLRSHATDSYSSDIELMADTVAWLCRRALEVRP